MIESNNCLGIPVRYDSSAKIITDSRGFWRWREIVIGPSFFAFPPREQGALLLHEAGHCKLNHVLKLAWFIARSPRRLWRFFACVSACAKKEPAEFFAHVAKAMPDVAALRQAQEFEADRFAAGCGYGADLARAFSRIRSAGGPFHPHPAERVSRLIGQD